MNLRNKYKIVVRDKFENFRDTITYLNVQLLCVEQAETDARLDSVSYTLNLSKYELLYLRLATDISSIKEENETILHAGATMALE